MKNTGLLMFISIILVTASCTQKVPEDMVLVQGGIFINKTSNLFGKKAVIKDFLIGKYEVSQKEWTEVMENNPSTYKGDSLPVETVSWYDCIEYCNKRSIKEGLIPYYIINKEKTDSTIANIFDSTRWTVSFNDESNGYRLPTEAEWEYAAGGGSISRSYLFSGSNKIDDVAWFWQNSGDKYLLGVWNQKVIENNHNQPKRMGSKKPNELGIYDMSGNVREWCEDWYQDTETKAGVVRVWRGGGWMGGDFCCQSNFRGNLEANGKGPDQGFRVCRSK